MVHVRNAWCTLGQLVMYVDSLTDGVIWAHTSVSVFSHKTQRPTDRPPSPQVSTAATCSFLQLLLVRPPCGMRRTRTHQKLHSHMQVNEISLSALARTSHNKPPCTVCPWRLGKINAQLQPDCEPWTRCPADALQHGEAINSETKLNLG